MIPTAVKGVKGDPGLPGTAENTLVSMDFIRRRTKRQNRKDW